MHDQADELRELVRQSALTGAPAGPAPKLIVMGGGKGGVGATTIAVNLAVALARQGRRIALVDADLHHGGVAALCQITERTSVLDVLHGRSALPDSFESGPSGIQVLPGAWGEAEVAECSAAMQQRFVADLKSLGHSVDIVIVDVGGERDHFVRGFWQAADRVLLVATPDTDSILEAYAAVKVLLAGDASADVDLLVNLAREPDVAADVHRRISEACRRFLGLRIQSAGHVAADATVADAARCGQPFYVQAPRCDAARCVERVAAGLLQQLNVNGTHRRERKSA